MTCVTPPARPAHDFRSLLHGQGAPAAVLSPDGAVLVANAGLTGLLGVTEAELAGRPFSAWLAPPHDRTLLRWLQAREESVEMAVPLRLVPPGSTIAHLSLRRSPVPAPCLLLVVAPTVPPLVRRVLEQQQEEVLALVVERTEALSAANRQLQEELRRMQRLQSLNTQILTSDAVEPLLDAILHAAVDITRADQGAVQLWEPGSGTLQLAAHHGVGAGLLERCRVVAAGADTPCARVFREGVRVLIGDLAAAATERAGCEALRAVGLGALAATPLRSGRDRILGVLSVGFAAPHRPDESALAFLDVLARQAADAIERAQDLARRRQAEAALRLSEEKFSKTFAHNPAAITLVRLATGEILDFNETALALMGYARAEVLGRSASELGIWQDRAARAKYVHAVRHAGEVRGWEARFATKSGAAIDVLLSGDLIHVAGEELILSTFVDISARSRAEGALAAQQALLAAVLEQAPDPIVAMDREGRYILANSAARAHFGQDPVGKSVAEMMAPLGALSDAEGRPIPFERRPLQRALQGTRVHAQHQILTRPDGTRSEHLVSAIPIAFDPGQPPGVAVAVIIDITAEKATEQALRAALKEKEDALATNLALLREVHHRVKNNLQMLCDLLYLQMEALGDAEKAAVLREAYGRIYAVARLHEQLYQAIHSGRVTLDQYLRRLAQGFETVYPDAVVRVECVEGVTLDLDRAIHVGLLVNELVTNACKHGVLAGAACEVAVTVHLTGEQVVLQVRDSGPGLPPDFSLERSTSLGLRVVQILARRLVGTLRIANTPGATFALTFPLQDEPPDDPQ